MDLMGFKPNHLPSVLWNCWLGHWTRKTRPRYLPVMCLVVIGETLNLPNFNFDRAYARNMTLGDIWVNKSIFL